MPKFRNYSVNPSVEEIENSVRKNGGCLSGTGFGFDCPESPENPEVDGWKILLVDKRGMGNHGTFIAVATSPETYQMQKSATMRLLRQWADEMELRAQQADDEALPYGAEIHPEVRDKHNNAEIQTRLNFRESGDFACTIIPLLWSELHTQPGRNFMFADEKWSYFSHGHSNFRRVGDGRHRLWVRPIRKG